MKINLQTIKNKNKIELYIISDVHVGNVNTDLKFFEKTINEIKNNPNAYMLGLGDWIEGITPEDPRFELDAIDNNFKNGNLVLNQAKYIEKQFSKISDKIIGIHSGNHDEKIKKKHSIDLVEDICERLNLPYLEFSAMTKLKIIRKHRSAKFTIYSTHGSIAGRRKGNKINRLEEMASWYDADMYFMGHSHDMFLSYDNFYYLSKRNQLNEKIKLFGNSGCFLRGIQLDTSSYAEKANYSPNRIGYIKVEIYPEDNKFFGYEVMK